MTVQNFNPHPIWRISPWVIAIPFAFCVKRTSSPKIFNKVIKSIKKVYLSILYFLDNWKIGELQFSIPWTTKNLLKKIIKNSTYFLFLHTPYVMRKLKKISCQKNLVWNKFPWLTEYKDISCRLSPNYKYIIWRIYYCEILITISLLWKLIIDLIIFNNVIKQIIHKVQFLSVNFYRNTRYNNESKLVALPFGSKGRPTRAHY